MIPVNTDVVSYSYFMAGVVKIKIKEFKRL